MNTSRYSQVRELPSAPGPLDNPLKGWAAYSEPGNRHCLPTAMAYFLRSWRELEPERGKYRFDEWEQHWVNPAAKGKHVIFRVHLDYPTLPTGVPQWVVDRGVRLTPYDLEYGKGFAPDYDDPRLLEPLLEFIAALGKRYDRHPRIGFITLGTLGFWGEWHTYPRTEWFAKPETQQKVVAAYRKAFPSTILMARNPTGETGTQPWLGYHDDLFPEDTDTPGVEWNFLPTMRRSGRAENWRVAAIGAEMYPGQARKWMGEQWETTRTLMERMHLTWSGPYCPASERMPSETYLEHGHEMVRRMGYEFRLERIHSRIEKRFLHLKVEGVNQGVAPFYYPWPIEVALLTPDGRIAQRHRTNTDVRRWLPGPFLLETFFPLTINPKGHRLALGIIGPWKERNTIRFANRLETVGSWTVLDTVG